MLKAFFSVVPVTSASGAAARYVPLMVLTRMMAAARFLLVAWLLRLALGGEAAGDEGAKGAYGVYQFSLEVINWAVPISLFGLADVVERYAATFQREGMLAEFTRRHVWRLAGAAGGVMAVSIAGAPMLSRWIFGAGTPAAAVIFVAGNVAVLAFYQWTAAALRGVRAYAAAAGLETVAAGLLLVLSAAAAFGGRATWLLVAYGLANLVPLVWYLVALWKFSHGAGSVVPPVISGAASAVPAAFPKLNRFAMWSLVRLLMMMTFGVVALAGVKWLSVAGGADVNAGEFAMPYRIGQLLQYVAVMLWASTYGIAARDWAHGGKRRARVTLLRTGRLGGVVILLAAATALITADVLALAVPPGYRAAMGDLLPGMLAMFVWYGILALYSMMGDLEERPQLGALLWLVAVAIQAGYLVVQRGSDTAQHVALLASCTGLGVATLVLALAIFWRPARLTATAVPVGLIALAPLAFFVPWGLAWWTGPAAAGAVVAFLFISRLLIRPRDKRAMRRYAARRKARLLEVVATQS